MKIHTFKKHVTCGRKKNHNKTERSIFGIGPDRAE
jgi:hypothetical protein